MESISNATEVGASSMTVPGRVRTARIGPRTGFDEPVVHREHERIAVDDERDPADGSLPQPLAGRLS